MVQDAESALSSFIQTSTSLREVTFRMNRFGLQMVSDALNVVIGASHPITLNVMVLTPSSAEERGLILSELIKNMKRVDHLFIWRITFVS